MGVLISFSCFSVDDSDSDSETTPPNRKHFTGGGHWVGPVSLLVVWGDTWTLQRLHRYQNGTLCMPLWEGLLSPNIVSRTCSRFKETSSCSRRAGEGRGRYSTHLEDQSLLFCTRILIARATKGLPAAQWCKCLWSNNQKQTSLGAAVL